MDVVVRDGVAECAVNRDTIEMDDADGFIAELWQVGRQANRILLDCTRVTGFFSSLAVHGLGPLAERLAESEGRMVVYSPNPHPCRFIQDNHRGEIELPIAHEREKALEELQLQPA
jgi:hypothetical protein